METESKFLIERKFFVTLLVIILTSVMRWNGKVEASTFEQVMIWCSGIFVAGQVATNWVQFLSTKTTTIVTVPK